MSAPITNMILSLECLFHPTWWCMSIHTFFYFRFLFCFVEFPFPQNELILFCTFFAGNDNINMLRAKKIFDAASSCHIIWGIKYWFHFFEQKEQRKMYIIHKHTTRLCFEVHKTYNFDILEDYTIIIILLKSIK